LRRGRGACALRIGLSKSMRRSAAGDRAHLQGLAAGPARGLAVP
jgi:hypothetical protein